MGSSFSRKHARTRHLRPDTQLDTSYTPLMHYVHDNVIGHGIVFNGPYGDRAGEAALKSIYFKNCLKVVFFRIQFLKEIVFFKSELQRAEEIMVLNFMFIRDSFAKFETFC